jgi:hypothetical protein
MMRSEQQGSGQKRVTPAQDAETGDERSHPMMNDSPLPPPPHSAPLLPEEVQAGRRLTEALVQAAAEHARDRGISDAVVVGALIFALGSVSASIARARGFDLGRYEEFVAGYFARVFQSESQRVIYH